MRKGETWRQGTVRIRVREYDEVKRGESEGLKERSSGRRGEGNEKESS